MQNDADFLRSFNFLSRKTQYKETPVSVEEFICSDRFLGKLTRQGKETYPRWKKELTYLMNEPTKYVSVYTGAIGTGKSRTAIIGVAYCMYIHLLLRDPWGYYHKDSAGKMAIVFFNLNKTLSESKGFNILQNYLLHSEWFCERGRISGTVDKKIHFDLFEYVLASPRAEAETGQDVIIALMDEVDSRKSTMKTNEMVIKSVESALRRLENRFVINGQTLGKFFIIASKQEKAAFIDAYITENRDNPEVHVVDIPIWEAKEDTNWGDKTFPIKLGDLYTPSKMLENEEDVRKALLDGFKIINVPDTEKFRRAFTRDIVGSLRDFAGISVSYLRKNKLFKAEQYILECYDKTKQDPVSVIDVPLGTKDARELIHYLDASKIRLPRGVPRFIHGDIAWAEGTNAYGLAMCGISGWTKVVREDAYGNITTEKLPVVETDFVMRIVAPEGDEIPIGRIRKFIIDLKKIEGFNIRLCTFDLVLASKDTTQILETAGINCEYKSVDKKPDIYRSFRDLVKEGRWVCHKHEVLHRELVNLEDDITLNKIDHPEKIIAMEATEDGSLREYTVFGSKDCSDAVAASAMSALDKCEMPPDVQILRKGLANHTPEVIIPNPLDIAGINVKPVDNLYTKEEPKSTNTFGDMFRRTQKPF